jgi:hypothetical protein
MPEVGSYEKYSKFSSEEDSEEGSEQISESLKDAINLLKDQSAHVNEEPENAKMLEQLIADAQEFYSVDESGWELLLNETRRELAKEDEPAVVKDIIRAAISKGASELM